MSNENQSKQKKINKTGAKKSIKLKTKQNRKPVEKINGTQY